MTDELEEGPLEEGPLEPGPLEPGPLDQGPKVKALLCEFARVTADGTLTIIGAGGNALVTNPNAPHPVMAALAIMISIPWTTTNREHRLTVELMGDGGSERGGVQRVPINLREQTWLPDDERGIYTGRFTIGRPAFMTPGSESNLPMVVPLYGRPLPFLGTYFFVIRLNGVIVDRVSFQLLSLPYLQGG